jgi:hypothetical protein
MFLNFFYNFPSKSTFKVHVICSSTFPSFLNKNSLFPALSKKTRNFAFFHTSRIFKNASRIAR